MSEMGARASVSILNNSGLKQGLAALLAVLISASPTLNAAGGTRRVGTAQGLQSIRAYISTGWDTLTRSMTDCATIVDPKLAATSVLYLPADYAVPAAIE